MFVSGRKSVCSHTNDGASSQQYSPGQSAHRFCWAAAVLHQLKSHLTVGNPRRHLTAYPLPAASSWTVSFKRSTTGKKISIMRSSCHLKNNGQTAFSTGRIPSPRRRWNSFPRRRRIPLNRCPMKRHGRIYRCFSGCCGKDTADMTILAEKKRSTGWKMRHWTLCRTERLHLNS